MSNLSEKLTKKFNKVYGRKPDYVSFCPYRICPVGAHIDHQHGKIVGIAIDKGITFVFGAKQNGVTELSSINFEKRAQFHVASVPAVKQDDWADYLRGATIALGNKYPLKIGVCGIIGGDLPIGGLSSSAAVIISYLTALCRVNGIEITQSEIVTIARQAENEYVGVSCGILDQSCEVYCEKNKLLYLDTKTKEYELIEENKNMKPHDILIFFSGKERSLISSKYNMRLDECRVSAYYLKAMANLEYDKIENAYLRDVPYEVYEKHKDMLPENLRRRCEHFFGESKRVEDASKCWKNGDIEGFGKIIFESGKSSIENYQTGSDELIKLYNLMLAEEGVYGGRFSGAGFQGCCFALVNPEYSEKIIENITKKYLDSFPELEGKFAAYICHSADGVRIK